MRFPELRVLHWGPLLALSIITCITITTLHITLMWLPPLSSFSAALNHLVFLTLVGSTLYNFFCAMFIGPGYVPPGWQPDDFEGLNSLQYCTFCKGYKAPRAHHCRKCNRCVMKMDHHCPWINNCCGHKNHAKFTFFLLAAVCGCIHASILLCIGIYRAFHVNWYFLYGDRRNIVYLSLYPLIFSVFSMGLALGVIIAVGGLFYIQMKCIIKNETSIENWIVAKALGRYREEGDEFIYPYNLGWWRNIKQVLWDPPGNGIVWNIVDSCHQYTLTREQMIQKLDKRSRMKRYTIVQPYNGAWFPISKGLRTLCTPPCRDEPRIPLCVGDSVDVTRWQRNWLYGEKVQDFSASPDVVRVRGWFPRCCAVEFTSSDCEVAKVAKKTL